jgi:division protein CdvB (Snf7/Vps24/ESCRT-III family)
MSLDVDVNITFDKSLLKEILSKLTSLENKMATLEENTAIVAAIAASVAANTSVLESVASITDKIFAEVNKLVSDAGATIPGLAELQAAVTAQNDILVAQVSKSTAVDGLIPDLPPVPPVEVV